MNKIQSLIEITKKGCGKEISHTIKNVVTLCGNAPDFVRLNKDKIELAYKFELCPSCEAKLQAYLTCEKIMEEENPFKNRIDNEAEVEREIIAQQNAIFQNKVEELKIQCKRFMLDNEFGLFKETVKQIFNARNEVKI